MNVNPAGHLQCFQINGRASLQGQRVYLQSDDQEEKDNFTYFAFSSTNSQSFCFVFFFFISKRPTGPRWNRAGLGRPRHPTLSNLNGKKRSATLHFQNNLRLLVKEDELKTQVVCHIKMEDWFRHISSHFTLSDLRGIRAAVKIYFFFFSWLQWKTKTK